MEAFFTRVLIVLFVLMGAIVIGAIVYFFIYPPFSGVGCPKCKQRYAMVKTGREQTNDLYEVKCTSCGHREWKKDSSGDDSGA